jgi:fructose-1-phosphate kinase PfkB-like protein
MPDAMEQAVLARALREKGVGEVFLSLGAEGLLAAGPPPGLETGRTCADELWSATLPLALPAGLARVNDSGAGDAACAAIAWGFLRGLDLGERCSLALAAAMIAAASESPVNPDMDVGLLREVAKGIPHERIS